MNPVRLLITLTVLNTASLSSFAQDSLITQIVQKNLATFSIEKKTFTGNGWEALIKQIQQSDFVLIGEDHFTNEIPFFFSAVINKVKFDNFFCETDPYSAKILEDKFKTLSRHDLNTFIRDFGNTFSFFALQPEFNLLTQLIKSNTTILGTDQITSVADRLLCNELQKKTKSQEAATIYATIKDSSKSYFDNFLKGQTNPLNFPFYFLTDAFQKNLEQLSALKLSKEEVTIFESMKISAKIYKEQNHALRIQLMKNELMKVYDEWSVKKNLFKYGSVHLAKGESLLTIYDIGNLINNIADSKFKKSLHIMIVGKSGLQGSPFNGFPDQTVDENSDELKSLKPLFKAINGENWHCFDMLPLRKELEDGKVVTNNIELSRIIKGYDYVIIIPKVTASRFPQKD